MINYILSLYNKNRVSHEMTNQIPVSNILKRLPKTHPRDLLMIYRHRLN